MSLKDFKSLFIQNLTIDKFVMAQNGILPKLFSKTDIDIDLRKYRSSVYFENITDDEYKVYIAQSFENFKEYIMSNDEHIDYKYIWDFVTNQQQKKDYFLIKELIYLFLKIQMTISLKNRIDLSYKSLFK